MMRQTWDHSSVGMGDQAIERGGRRHAGGETTSNNLQRENILETCFRKTQIWWLPRTSCL